MAAKYNINFKGSGIFTDSFDSSRPELSDNGRYPIPYDASRTSTNGDVACEWGVVNVNGGTINGDLLLGPTANENVKGVITGEISHDFNMDFWDVELPPDATWMPPTLDQMNKTIDGTNYGFAFFGSGDYVISGLKSSVYVGTNAHVRLKLAGDASPASIRVSGMGPEAGSLAIYMTGERFAMSGTQTVDGGLAASFSYYGLPSNTIVDFGGNSAFTGTIYAPEADLKLGGGGTDTYDFVGAVVARSIMMNGHYTFHFDEALLRLGPKKGYIAVSWREI